MTILETHKLCKRFGGSQVTADVDLALQHHLEGHSLAGEIRR